MTELSRHYQSRIHGDYLTIYRAEFPLPEVLAPPEGWAFKRVTEWRKNCPDYCWRVIYVRVSRPTPEKE